MTQEEINERIKKFRQHIGEKIEYLDVEYLLLDVSYIGFSEIQILKPNQQKKQSTNFSNGFRFKVKNLSTNKEKFIDNDDEFESILIRK